MEGGQTSMKDNLQRKTILDGRQPSMQDDLWREKTELLKCNGIENDKITQEHQIGHQIL